jgi:predicted RecB family endonuclease
VAGVGQACPNIVGREARVEFDGEPVYEFDIVDEEGIEWKVEVSAETGDIKMVGVEAWQIGLEKR